MVEPIELNQEGVGGLYNNPQNPALDERLGFWATLIRTVHFGPGEFELTVNLILFFSIFFETDKSHPVIILFNKNFNGISHHYVNAQ